MESDMVQSYKSDEPEEPIYSQIHELRTGNTHIHLRAKVKKVSKPQIVNTQYGNQIPMAKALLTDETGEINLCLWKEQIDSVYRGDYIEVQNATVRKFRDKNQLTLGNKGAIKTIQRKKANAKTKSIILEQAKTRL